MYWDNSTFYFLTLFLELRNRFFAFLLLILIKGKTLCLIMYLHALCDIFKYRNCCFSPHIYLKCLPFCNPIMERGEIFYGNKLVNPIWSTLSKNAGWYTTGTTASAAVFSSYTPSLPSLFPISWLWCTGIPRLSLPADCCVQVYLTFPYQLIDVYRITGMPYICLLVDCTSPFLISWLVCTGIPNISLLADYYVQV